MKLKELLNDDSAVSPVIGVILMVAITVILAAVIATFVLGLGEQVSDTAPSASFTFDLDEQDQSNDDWHAPGDDCDGSDEGMLTIRHAGGPTIDASQLSATGSSATNANDPAEFDDGPFGPGSDVSAGTSADLCINTGDRIDVTWQSGDGNSATLATYRGPDA